MRRFIIEPDIRLSADGLLHTVPFDEVPLSGSRRNRELSPFCDADYADSDLSRRRGIYHRISLHSKSADDDAAVCLTCDRPFCNGEQMCYNRRRTAMLSSAETNAGSVSCACRGAGDAD